MMKLKDIIREMYRMVEARPEAMGAKGQRGLPPTSWGGRRVYDKKTGEAFDVADFLPRDPDEEVETVVLKSRDKHGKVVKVSYDEYLGNYLRHSGQPVSTFAGREAPAVRGTEHEEFRARGAVDIDPKTGEFIRLPSSVALDKDMPRFEDEIAIDKMQLAFSDLGGKKYNELITPYIDEYKQHLQSSIVKAQKAIKEYALDMLETGELDDDDVKWFKTAPGYEIYAAIWELPNFHEYAVPKLGIKAAHVSTISSIVSATGKLAVSLLNDPKTEDAIKHDPGFVTWLSKANKGKFWNELRKAAEAAGKYRGQF
jgi:hypothetical protein